MSLSLGWKPIAELLDEHGPALELYAAQWTHSPGDCVQEAFVELSVYIQQNQQLPQHAKAWLYRVVRNRSLNAARAQRRRDHYERMAAQLIEKQAVGQSDPEQLQLLMESLDALPTNDREVVVLRIWSGMTWQEIADLTETSSSTAHRNYVAALNKLKQQLEQPCLPKIQ